MPLTNKRNQTTNGKGRKTKRAKTNTELLVETPVLLSTNTIHNNTSQILSALWTDDEDSTLRDGVLRHGELWDTVRDFLLIQLKGARNHSSRDCENRWKDVVCRKHKKGPWTEDEDRLVCNLVKAQGPKKWSTLAVYVPGRTGKQCRERWVNHLSPDVNKGEWSEEEERTLIEEHERLGNQWCKIAQSLPGRSENAVKNRWNSFANRCMSQQKGDPTINGGMMKQKGKKISRSRGSMRKESSGVLCPHNLLAALVSPKKVVRYEDTTLTQSPKPSSMINIRRRLAKPLFINPRISLLGEDEVSVEVISHDQNTDMTDFDSVLHPQICSPTLLCPLSPALLSPMSPQCSLNAFKFSPLSSLWPKSPLFPSHIMEKQL